jgi:hypothetical protein
MRTKKSWLFFCLLLIGLFFYQWLNCEQKLSKEEQYPGMRVMDRFLYTKYNEKVILRGINQMIIWLDQDGIPSFQEIAKTGANVVRIVWLTTGAPETLDVVINNCINEKMIPLIELHDATGNWAKLQLCVDYWIRPDVIKVIKKHQEYLLLNIANEVGDSSVNKEKFISAYTDAVARMRKAGIHVPLIIDSIDWGKNIDMLQEAGFDLLAADPDHNLLFSIHMWWPALWGYSKEKVIQEIKESVDMGLPLIVGEFGNAWDETDEGKIPYLTIIEECQKNEIGWIAWSWGPGNTPQTHLNMTEDGTFKTLHGWGLELAVTSPYSIKNTALKPQSLGGTVKPGPTPDPDSWKKNSEKALAQKPTIPAGGKIIALKAKNPINVDGNLQEWPLSSFGENQKIMLDQKAGNITAGKIESDSDFRAITYVLYDDSSLYIAAEVTDDNIVKTNECENNWRNDCLEIWIDGADDDGTMIDNGGNDPDNYQLNVDVNGCVYVYRNKNASELKKNIKAAAKIKDKGYILEIKIPFASIPELDLELKKSMGFSISFVDADKTAESEWNHILWQGKKEHEPKEWGTLQFIRQ